jgi:uncharacterized protein involved in exopolysaccharide biosynthesis
VSEPSALGRVQDCEVDDATFRRIRDLTQRLDELRTRYTEQHPEVIATRRQLQEVQDPLLADCVERLQ